MAASLHLRNNRLTKGGENNLSDGSYEHSEYGASRGCLKQIRSAGAPTIFSCWWNQFVRESDFARRWHSYSFETVRPVHCANSFVERIIGYKHIFRSSNSTPNDFSIARVQFS